MIEARGLRKTYRARRGRKATTVDAVRGVDFAVQRAEIFGFLGPNGAGKTTTLRMLATLLRPDGGEATIAGVDLRRDPGQVRQRIGPEASMGVGPEARIGRGDRRPGTRDRARLSSCVVSGRSGSRKGAS